MKIDLDFAAAPDPLFFTMPKKQGLEWSEVLRIANEEGFRWSAIGTARNYFTQHRQLGKRPKLALDGRGRPTEDSLRAVLQSHAERKSQ